MELYLMLYQNGDSDNVKQVQLFDNKIIYIQESKCYSDFWFNSVREVQSATCSTFLYYVINIRFVNLFDNWTC